MNPKKIAYVALFTGICSQIFSPFFVRWGGAEVPGPVFAFYRILIGGVVIFFLFLQQKRSQIEWNFSTLIYPVMGGICTAVDLSLWNTGLHKTSIANATLMSNTAPVWVVLASILFFKESYRKAFWFGLFLSLAGAAVVLSYDFVLRPHLSAGDLFSLASGIFYGGYYLSTQHGRMRLPVIDYLLVMSTAASIALLVFCSIAGFSFFGYSSQAYLAAAGAGVFVQVIAYVGVAYALGHLPATVVSPTVILQPVLSTLLAIPLFHEDFIPVQWIGLAGVLAGVYLINRNQNKPIIAAEGTI
jgi:drug/metabolite transporter (DMT)-like permease